jgi:hypothetical protein
MNRRLVGGIVATAGVVVLVLSALAEPIGIGSEDGFGAKQVIGLALYARRGREASPQPDS